MWQAGHPQWRVLLAEDPASQGKEFRVLGFGLYSRYMGGLNGKEKETTNLGFQGLEIGRGRASGFMVKVELGSSSRV